MRNKIAMSVWFLSFAVAFCAADRLWADEWTDSDTGIIWTYRIIGGNAILGGGNSSSTAVPKSTSGFLTIPSTLCGHSVKTIGNYAFYGCDKITGVDIPSCVTSIDTLAFGNCTGLTSVTVPDGVTNIMSSVFRGCSGLSSVSIPDSVMSIGSSSFLGCNYALYDWETIPGAEMVDGWIVGRGGPMPENMDLTGARGVASDAFGLSTSQGFKSVTIPASLTKIGDGAFSYCVDLESIIVEEGNSKYRSVNGMMLTIDGKTLLEGVNGNVDIPDGVTKIGAFAFGGRGNLTDVTIPDSVTDIGAQAFFDCCNLSELEIPQDVTSIGESAFFNCIGLSSISIPSNVTSVGKDAFMYCRNLESVIFKGDAPSVGNNLFDNVSSSCTVYVSKSSTGWGVDIPGEWKGLRIEYMSFELIFEDGVVIGYEGTCPANLNIANYSSNVARIGDRAFSGCSGLANVAIPDSVEAIAPTAFDGCEKLWAKWFKTLERISADGAATGNEVSLTVTNVVVHYVTQSVPSAAVAPPEITGLVNVIAEITSGGPVAISSEWASQYDGFVTKFGSDFTAALTKPTGKRDGAGNEMLVWQDFVAGTDPTKEDDVFKASITFDGEGKPIISWTPELSEDEAAKRVYRKFGKVRLNDKDWTLINGDEEDYNFFKVSVEMR